MRRRNNGSRWRVGNSRYLKLSLRASCRLRAIPVGKPGPSLNPTNVPPDERPAPPDAYTVYAIRRDIDE
jgi:hypothetical protein